MNKDFILKDNNKIDFEMGAKGTIKVYPPLDNLEITPGKETLVLKNNVNYGYDTVIVNKIPDEYVKPTGLVNINKNGITDVSTYKTALVNVEAEIPEGLIKPSGTLTISENGIKDVTEFAKVDVNVVGEYKEPTLQTKEVTPNKNIQVVTSDSEYDGLNEVKVNPIPDEYIIPNLQEIEVIIRQNGDGVITPDEEYDGISKVIIHTEIKGGGSDSDSEDINLSIGDYVAAQIPKYIEGRVNNYPSITTDNVTLYTPNSNYKNYMIRNRGGSYGIVWFPDCILTSTGSGLVYSREIVVYLKSDGRNATTSTQFQTYDLNVTAYTSNFNTFEECVAAIQNPNTVYTTTSNSAWSCMVDGSYNISATNMLGCLTNNNGYITGDLSTRKISSNETIETI